MLRDKAIRNKLLGVLGFVIVLQASVIGWSLMSPVGASEAKLPQDFQHLATHSMGNAAIISAMCDTARGNLIYYSVLAGRTTANHHLVVVENGCPRGGKP